MRAATATEIPDFHPQREALPDADDALLQLARALEHRGYRFTTVTPATHARVNGRPGNEWARTLQDVFGWSRPFHADLLPPELFDLLRRAGAAAAVGDGWRSRVRVSSLEERLFIHSAYPTTQADAVFFGPDSYRFVSAIQRHLAERSVPIRRAVDIGCGAGPGAITLASERPQADVLAVDINAAALRLTRINAALAGMPNISLHSSDLLTSVGGAFDLIVANPPYLLDPAERAYRHGGGPLGVGLSLAIVDAARERLAPGGTLLLYTGVAILNGIDSFRSAAGELLEASGFSWNYRELDPDVFGEELLCEAYASADRIAAVLLLATRPG